MAETLTTPAPTEKTTQKVDGTEVLFGLYNDEEILMDAVKKARADHLDIMDVYTPFPLHGLDPILGLSESRLLIAGFIYGLTGASL